MSTSPFDFSHAMTQLCEDVAIRLDEFQHIRMEHVAVTFAQTRRQVSYGLQAKLTPMRFENGDITTYRRGKAWTVERIFDGDREMLYLLTFYLPRFLNHTFREKMITILHELYHISPHFDGDIRRLSGRCYAHSHSQKEYDRLMEHFVDKYLTLDPPGELFTFLKNKYQTLCARHGSVVGLQVPIPRLIPVPDSNTA